MSVLLLDTFCKIFVNFTPNFCEIVIDFVKIMKKAVGKLLETIGLAHRTVSVGTERMNFLVIC